MIRPVDCYRAYEVAALSGRSRQLVDLRIGDKTIETFVDCDDERWIRNDEAIRWISTLGSPDGYVAIADLAARAKCTPNTIRRAIRTGALAATSINRRRRYISEAEADRWLASRARARGGRS